MGRLLLVLAGIILIVGLVAAGIAIGRRLERAAARRQASFIDPTTYHEMSNFVRSVLGAQPVDDPAYIPEWMKEQGKPIIVKIGKAQRALR